MAAQKIKDSHSFESSLMAAPAVPIFETLENFQLHLQQISEDFRELESRIRALSQEKLSLQRENADLKSGAGNSKLCIAGFQGDSMGNDILENQFQEAFGENYQNKLPVHDKISQSAKFQKSQTVSRSNSGEILGSLSLC
eukprot:Skav232814  [mRNA]  locus=scaffold614:561615:562848:- [translate_table: standard]